MSNEEKGWVEIATYGLMVAMSMWPGTFNPRLQRSTLHGDDGGDLNAGRQDLSSHLASVLESIVIHREQDVQHANNLVGSETEMSNIR